METLDRMIECKICTRKFSDITKYNDHLKLHKHLPNVVFYCLEINCKRKFYKYQNFYQHVYRNHRLVKRHVINCFKTLTCKIPNCSFTMNSKFELSSHISQHIKKKKENVRCPLEPCNQKDVKFTNISTWRVHLNRKHSNLGKRTVEEFSTRTSQYDRDLDNDTNLITPNSVASPETNNCNYYVKSLALLYLTLQTKLFVSSRALCTIIEGIKDLHEILFQDITGILKQKYKIQDQDVDEISQKLNFFSNVHDSAHGELRSNYIRVNYYRDNFDYIAPQEITLGFADGSLRKYYYIPIIITIKSMFKNDNIIKQWQTTYPSSDSNVFCNITDGSVFKNNDFFINNPNALRILLFQDAFEICNPLGSAKKKYKVIGVYMVLANTETFTWSRVNNIALVALAFETDIVKFGFSKIFSVILKDLKILETQGIDINNVNVKGTVLAMLGDNLGSHQIGGFTENFSTNSYICRYCYIKSEDIALVVKNFKYRNKESYEQDLNIKIASNDIHYRGVKQQSVLNSLEYYHVATPGLPPCIAHDMFEGVVQYDLALIINYFIQNNYISLEDLNIKIRNLKFKNFSVKNLPAIKSKGDKLPGNAHQNMVTLQILPFALFDIININDPVWEMLLILREVCNILLSIKVHFNQIIFLRSLIFEYIECRKALFPSVALRPKHHYLLHYYKLILQFGPLRLLWTLRFESKHKYFKNIVKHSSNFKNILSSLSENHQLLQALCSYQHQNFADSITADSAVLFDKACYTEQVQNLLHQFCTFIEPFFISKYVVYRGIEYKENTYLCYCNKLDQGTFLLLKITYIIIDQNYNNMGFIGSTVEIVYNSNTGLYHETGKNEQLIYKHYKDLILHDLLYVTNNPLYNSENLYYFKSAPFSACINELNK